MKAKTRTRWALFGIVLLVATAAAFSVHTMVSVEDAQTITGAKTFKSINNKLYASGYGVVGDGTTANTTAFNTAVSSACAAGAKELVMDSPGKYRFTTAPAAIGCGLKIICPPSPGAAFGYGSIFYVDYTESTATNGFLTWDGSLGATEGNGGGIEGCMIWKATGQTGGTALKFTGTTTSNRAGFDRISGVRVTGQGTWNKDLIIDGSAITTAGSQGVRDEVIADSFFFGATDSDQSIYLNNCAHCFFSNVLVDTGSGSGTGITVTGATGSTSTSQNVNFANVEVTGDLVLDYVNAFVGANVYLGGNYSSTSNTTASKVSGVIVGSITNGGGVSLYLSNKVSEVGNLTASGVIQTSTGQVIGGSQPANCNVAGYGCFSSSTTQGTVLLGSDGNGVIRRNSSQFSFSFDGLSTSPFVVDGSNGAQTKPTTFSTLGTCNSTNEGFMKAITDSSTATWGATITGGSTNHVLAYCDGTNWTVAGK